MLCVPAAVSLQRNTSGDPAERSLVFLIWILPSQSNLDTLTFLALLIFGCQSFQQQQKGEVILKGTFGEGGRPQLDLPAYSTVSSKSSSLHKLIFLKV
jgi:hypothetical protein